MKVLINANFKALRTGDYVKASEKAGEAIIDSNDDISVAVLKEVAGANKIDIKGLKKKDDIHKAVFDGINKMGLPTMSEKTDSDKVKDIVKAGIEAGKNEDQILVEIVNSGVKFSAATRYYKEALKESGMYISSKDRKEQATAILKEMEFAPESFQDVQDAVVKIREGVVDTDDKKALSAIRAYCKENEIAMPKKAKGGAGGNRSSIRTRTMDFVLANPGVTLDELKAHIVENEENGKEKHAENFWAIVEFARKYADAVNA